MNVRILTIKIYVQSCAPRRCGFKKEMTGTTMTKLIRQCYISAKKNSSGRTPCMHVLRRSKFAFLRTTRYMNARALSCLSTDVRNYLTSARLTWRPCNWNPKSFRAIILEKKKDGQSSLKSDNGYVEPLLENINEADETVPGQRHSQTD